MTQNSITQRAVMTVANEAAQQWPARAERIAAASEILMADQIEQIDGDLYRVWSRSNPGAFYLVTRQSCECKGRKYRPHLACAHMVALRLLPLVQDAAAEMAALLAAQFSPEEQKRLEFGRYLVERGMVSERVA